MLKEFFRKHKLVFLIIAVLILSIGGGIIGGLLARSYLIDVSYNLSALGDLDFSRGKLGDQGIVISNAKNVIVEQDVKIEETIESAGTSLVGIYKKRPTVKPGDIFFPDNFYELNKAAGQGFIITSDGWLVTALALDKVYADYVVITKDKKLYQIDKAVSDGATGFNFIHVAVKDFPVKKIAAKSDIKRGSLTVSVNWAGLSWLSSVFGFKEESGLVKSSDNFSAKLILNSDLPPEFKGATVFNLAGDALGIVDAKGEIEPLAHLAAAANSLFKNKVISRPNLGLNYIDLAWLAAAGGENNYWQKGAIIYPDAKNIAVKKGGPADMAGLKEGDIIISVNNISLDKTNNLADVVQSHAAGDKINLVIKRAGAEKAVEVILGEQK